MRSDDRYRQALTLAVGFVAAAVIFTLWPGIDITVTSWFHSETSGFTWARSTLVNIARDVIKNIMYAMTLLALAFWVASFTGWKLRSIPGRLWGFIFTLFIIGPGILVNWVLKEHWGRARPSSTTEFGGTADFTPALRITDQCATNCSFVSGEGSGATALALSFVLLAPYLLPIGSKGSRKRQLAALLIIPAIGLLLRVAMGRHFLSDTIFAILIVLAVAFLLAPLFFPRRAQEK